MAFYLLIIMLLLQNHVLHLHQGSSGTALIFGQLHSYELYSLLVVRYHDMLQGIHSPAGLLYLVRHKLAGFLHLRKPYHLGENFAQCAYCTVSVTGRKGCSV